MKIPTLFLASIIFACLAFTAFAADPVKPTASPEVKAAVVDQLFRAGEFQIDALYQARTRDIKSFEHGGGVRLAYFPWRAAGFGLEGRTEDVSSAIFDRVGLSLIGRFPVDKLRLSPEIRVGFSYDMEDSQERGESPHNPVEGDNRPRPDTGFDVFASIGGELRLFRNVGIFAEVRGVKPLNDATREHVLGLAGIRISL